MAYKKKMRVKPRRKVRSRKASITRAIKSNLVSIKRSVRLDNFSTSTTFTANSYVFTLSALPGASEFTALFEQYKINAVKLTFIPFFNSMDSEQQLDNVASARSWTTTPRVFTCIDKDGAPPTSETLFLERGNMRLVKRPLDSFSIYISKPCVQFGTANLLAITGGAPKPSPWIDCDNFNIQHWGCAIGAQMPASSAGTSFIYSVVATYYMQFKGAC